MNMSTHDSPVTESTADGVFSDIFGRVPVDDEKNLRYLSRLFTATAVVAGGLIAMSALSLIGGSLVVDFANFQKTGAASASTGDFLLVGSAVAVVLALLNTLSLMVAAIGIRKRRFRLYCIAMSCLLLPGVPIATVIGIYGLVVLTRPSVKRLFQHNNVRPIDD